MGQVARTCVFAIITITLLVSQSRRTSSRLRIQRQARGIQSIHLDAADLFAAFQIYYFNGALMPFSLGRPPGPQIKQPRRRIIDAFPAPYANLV